jgi:uncharacterized membrane protein YsdA (DUF1294 family)
MTRKINKSALLICFCFHSNFILFFSLFGGWIGAFAAMRIFRHKTQKLGFQVCYLATAIANAIILILFIGHYYFGLFAAKSP